MRVDLTTYIPAPIDVVFAFLDDPANTLEFAGHARSHVEHLQVVAVRPDGARTFDLQMRSGGKTWVQTIDQEVRQSPTRLMTRGWTWTIDREQPVLTVTTDRRLYAEGEGTRLHVTVETRLDHPWKRPYWAIVGWRQRGAMRLGLEHQIHLITERLAARDATPASSGDIPER
jgi:uncharacterized protein YndB with AHSA1/START domain